MENLEGLGVTARTELKCRACHAPGLFPALDLGCLPLANSLLSKDQLTEPEDRFALELYLCRECALVQIGETVPPERLFRNYVYASSFSETMLSHAQELTRRLARERGLGAGSTVVEIASNDGYLLQYYKALGIGVLGIEPAENIAQIAEETRGIPTVVDFFGPELAARLAGAGQQADVIHAHNVFAHVPDPGSLIEGCRQLLRPDGLVLIEAPYVRELVEKIEFDTIYHEHFSYFSLTAADRIVRARNMIVSDVELVPIHGGSLRLFITHAGAAPQSPRVIDMLEDEAACGLAAPEYFADFASTVKNLQQDLTGLLRTLKDQGHSIAAYGASAKGSTLMNAFGIDGRLIDFVVDRSPLKQGKYTPGNHLPILSPDALMEHRPDDVLLLTWNFADEILNQQHAYREAGGRFIIPLPDLQVV